MDSLKRAVPLFILLTLVSEARVRFFQSLGYPESNVAGAPIVVGDLVAQYKSEGFHGETMVVERTPSAFNKYGFDLQYRMSDKDSLREVALVKVTPIPAEFLAKVQTLAWRPLRMHGLAR